MPNITDEQQVLLKGYLPKVKIFNALPSSDLDAIAKNIKPVEFPAGATIFNQDETGESFYVVVKGQLNVSLRGVLL